MHAWREVPMRLTACRTRRNPIPACPRHPRRIGAQKAALAPARPRGVLACCAFGLPVPPCAAARGCQQGQGAPPLCSGDLATRACTLAPWCRIAVGAQRAPGFPGRFLDTQRAARPVVSPRDRAHEAVLCHPGRCGAAVPCTAGPLGERLALALPAIEAHRRRRAVHPVPDVSGRLGWVGV